jgi:hypothetical protein
MLDGFGVHLPLLVLDQCLVDASRAWVAFLAFGGGTIRSRRMSSMDSPFARRRSTVCSMSSVMTGGRWLVPVVEKLLLPE